MNRNLSDCAAMACLPAAALATSALPKGTSLDYAKELYLGMKEAADLFDCALVGGDTASWPHPLTLTVTILGRSAGIQPITRSGAKPGDFIYVTGPLGGSILGRHMNFEPRIQLARSIAKTGDIHAMIDISDGLSRDLRHICDESGVGALLYSEEIPIHRDAFELFRRDHISPLEHALHDGEDHELLFASPSGLSGTKVIGRFVAGDSIQMLTKEGLVPVDPKGWEHQL